MTDIILIHSEKTRDYIVKLNFHLLNKEISQSFFVQNVILHTTILEYLKNVTLFISQDIFPKLSVSNLKEFSENSFSIFYWHHQV